MGFHSCFLGDKNEQKVDWTRISDNGNGTETRTSNQQSDGSFMTVTRATGTNGDDHVTRSYNGNGELTNTHTTEVTSSGREHYGSEDLKGFSLGAVVSAIFGSSKK